VKARGKAVVLVTGANGEIGRALLQTLAADGAFDGTPPASPERGRDLEVVTLDLTPLPDAARPLASTSYTGNIMDRYLLDQLAAHHEVDMVFHLAALLSTRGERDPELAHQVNVEGTLNVLRMAQNQSSRLGRPVRVLFPSSIAVYGLPSLESKHRVGRVREEEWNVPITMYGCNKLYCEHLGRYLTFHARQLGALSGAARLDFRALRFPGLISADTVPAGGTSDFGPEMIHAAARGVPYRCFVEPEARIPFMAMPDAVRALMELAAADREQLSSCVYNIGAFSVSAGEIGDRVRRAFPGAEVEYEPDPVRARIVASWPEDVDDSRARSDWGWKAAYGWERAFDEYLVPSVRARYPRA
jgi:nucleoside-diphosphate-sugar epimerase